MSTQADLFRFCDANPCGGLIGSAQSRLREIHEASTLADDVGGDPEEGLNGLFEEVNYFRDGTVEELREYLREEW